jgi:formylmethanofuran dehydrogenase subunit E
LIVTIVAVAGMAFAAIAYANNLDRRTAQNAAKFAAKKECQATSGCTGYGAGNVRLLTHHKASGKIFINSTKNGERFQCRKQIVITLDHFTGDIRYFLSGRRCTDLGPA